ncbi:hypothetical protein V6Z11_A03G020400 [Gossypium hirsutum]
MAHFSHRPPPISDCNEVIGDRRPRSEGAWRSGTGLCWRVYGSHADVRGLGVVAGGVVQRLEVAGAAAAQVESY